MSIHSRAERKSSPKSKQRTLSPIHLTSSPYSLRRRVPNEIPVAGEGYDSDRDRSANDEHTSHKKSSKYIEETYSCSSDQHDDSYDTENTRTSAERSLSRSKQIILESALSYHRSVSFVPKSAAHTFRTQSQPTVQTNSAMWKFLLALMAGTVIVCGLIFGPLTYSVPPKERISCPQFKELTKHFLHQDMLLWKSLKIGIENVLNKNPAKPSVFLLAYSDIDTTQNLMANILNATANCMQTTRPIELNGATFATAEMIKDYGEIIAKYRDQLKQEKIMYVSDVNKTPAAAAQVFHTICDTIEPLVDKAVIFFTVYLEPDNYEPNPASVLHKVEKVLETNWLNEAVSENSLKALIGRVTDQVFLLRSEKHVDSDRD